jgi:dCMP deaminase
MEITKLIGQNSKCNRKKVGCVATRDGRIIASGYNGTPPNFENICEKDDKTTDFVIHAEQNLIAFCSKYGISLKGSTIIITLSPCVKCATLLIQAGVKAVFFDEEYRDKSGVELLINNGIMCSKL